MNGPQVVEEDFFGQEVGIVVVNRLDAQQREVALVLFRRADGAGHNAAVSQAEASDLTRRDIDVVRAGEVMVIGTAEKAEPVG